MITRTWHKGPPPFPGWWNASNCRNELAWRWWNGTSWSEHANAGARPKRAALSARRPYEEYRYPYQMDRLLAGRRTSTED